MPRVGFDGSGFAFANRAKARRVVLRAVRKKFAASKGHARIEALAISTRKKAMSRQ
jgi:hypothetical protein